jgi:hypothetical protein
MISQLRPERTPAVTSLGCAVAFAQGRLQPCLPMHRRQPQPTRRNRGASVTAPWRDEVQSIGLPLEYLFAPIPVGSERTG